MLPDWESIVRTHGPMAFDTAWRLLGNAADAEDIVQDTLLDAFRLHSHRTVGNWGGLLRRLAVCRAIDRLRTRQSVQPLTDEPASVESDRPEAAMIEARIGRTAALGHRETTRSRGGSVFAAVSGRDEQHRDRRHVSDQHRCRGRRASQGADEAEGDFERRNHHSLENAKMKTEHEPTRDLSDDLLDRAIQAARAQPVPQDVRQRVMETAAAWRDGSSECRPQQGGLPSIPTRPTSGHFETSRQVRAALSNFRRRIRLGLVAVAALAVAVATTLWLSRPNESWAQVAEALRTKPWSLGKYTTPDGETHEDWTSFSRGVSAHRHGDFVQFSDHRLNVTYEYNAKEKTLTRRLGPDADGKKGADSGFEDVFQQICRGAEKLNLAAAGVELVEQKRGSVAKHGRHVAELRSGNSHCRCGRRRREADCSSDVSRRPTNTPSALSRDERTEHEPSVDRNGTQLSRDGPHRHLQPGRSTGRQVSRSRADRRHPAGDLRDQVVRRAIRSASGTQRHERRGGTLVCRHSARRWRKGTSYRMVYGLVDADSIPPKTPEA